MELAMDDLDPLGMSQSLDPCLGMPPMDPRAQLAYPYPLDFMGLPQEGHLGENSDTPNGKDVLWASIGYLLPALILLMDQETLIRNLLMAFKQEKVWKQGTTTTVSIHNFFLY